MRIDERLDPARLKAVLDRKVHPGLHCHVFQTETFGDKFLKPLQRMGLIEFEMLAFRGALANTGGEFSLVLRKQPVTVELTTEQFFTKDYEQGQPESRVEPAPEPVVEIPHLKPQRTLLSRIKSWVSN